MTLDPKKKKNRASSHKQIACNEASEYNTRISGDIMKMLMLEKSPLTPKKNLDTYL